MAVGAAINGNAGSFTWNNGWTEGIDQSISTSTNQNRQAIVGASLAVAHSI